MNEYVEYQFEYEARGRQVKLSYYLAPEEILEDREEAARWARRSFEAALRAAAAKTKPAGKRPGRSISTKTA